MPDNNLTPDCLHRVGGAQLFMAPTWNPDQKGVKVQIIDVFALELATGLRLAVFISGKLSQSDFMLGASQQG